MAFTPAINPTTNRVLRALRQHEATTGNKLSPDQIRAIVEGGLSAEASVGLERARFGESKRQFDENLKLRKDKIANEELSATISGAADLTSLGFETFKFAPERIRVADEATAAFNARTEALLGNKAVTSVTGAGTPALTGAAAAGETGLSLATGAIPETFTSAATGQAVSTATGEAVGGSGILGSIGPAAGAFGIGGIASGLAGKGKGKLVSGAAAGAAYGSVVPGIGPVIGGVLGGAEAALRGDTVICAELNRQGYMPNHIMEHDSAFRKKYISIEEYIGYRMWADPLVSRMRVSRLTTLVIKPFALSWAYTMANKMDQSIKVNPIRRLVGSLILLFGRPYCRYRYNKITEGGICNA